MGLIEKFLHNLSRKRRAAPSFLAPLGGWAGRSVALGVLRTPRWGVHPDDHKRPAADAPLRTLPLPARLYVPLLQHVGQPARPLVLVGQEVLKGQLIAEPQGRISAPVHAPTSGRIVAIGEITAPHPSGLPFEAITLETDGHDRAFEADVPADPFALAPAEVTALIAAAGVVGLGGATFPSSVKLALGKRSEIDTLIVNGGECEPYLSCDDRIMRDRAADVIDGVRLMLHCTGAREALVGIENNKPEAIAAMRRAAARFPEIKVRPVPVRYPMGSDRQLIETLTGKEVPSDCRAADVGVIVNNVSTAAAVHRAVRFGEPLIRRIVTINGGAGNDTITLDGSFTGNTTLTGGEGKDLFDLTKATGTLSISDFVSGQDKLAVGLTKTTDFGGDVTSQLVLNKDGSVDLANTLSGAKADGIVYFHHGDNTYVLVNDNTAGYSAANDLLITLTGKIDLTLTDVSGVAAV